MNKFLTFETNAFRIDDKVFPCYNVDFSLQASTNPVFDINGLLLYYSPNSPIQGKVNVKFYLTGAFPEYCKAENQTENAQQIQFNNFFIPSSYLTDLSFDVIPYQPISINAGFVFYDGLQVLNTNLNDFYQEFSTGLSTLNGLGSRIVSTNFKNQTDFIISDFSYSFNVEREPIIRVRQFPRRDVPSRVALKKVNSQISIGANNINDVLTINGNEAILSAVLSDNENLFNSTVLNFTGIVVDQSYSISESEYGSSKLRAISTNVPLKRSIVTIPYEIENYSIITTRNQPPSQPPRIVTEILDKEKIDEQRQEQIYKINTNNQPVSVIDINENSDYSDGNNGDGNIDSNQPSNPTDSSNIQISPEDSIWCKFIVYGYLVSDPSSELTETEKCRLKYPHITSVESQNINETQNQKLYLFKANIRQPIFIERNLENPVSVPQAYDQVPYYWIVQIQMNKNFFNDLITSYTPDTAFSVRYRDHDWIFDESSNACALFQSTLNTISWSDFKALLDTAVANESSYGNGSLKNPYRLVYGLGG